MQRVILCIICKTWLPEQLKETGNQLILAIFDLQMCGFGGMEAFRMSLNPAPAQTCAICFRNSPVNVNRRFPYIHKQIIRKKTKKPKQTNKKENQTLSSPHFLPFFDYQDFIFCKNLQKLLAFSFDFIQNIYSKLKQLHLLKYKMGRKQQKELKACRFEITQRLLFKGLLLMIMENQKHGKFQN